MRPQQHSVIFHIIWLLLLFAQSLHSAFCVEGWKKMWKAKWNGIKVENIEAFVRSRVVVGFFHPRSLPGLCLHFLPLVAPLPSSFLICEVNWHVFIRHHVIKSNLRHPHTLAGRVNRKNASLKCLISYNYLIISRECFHPMINNFFVLERVSILRLASQPPVDVNYAAISNHEQLWIKSVEQLLFRFIESHINYSNNPHGN